MLVRVLHNKTIRAFLTAATFAAAVAVAPNTAQASPIDPGFDLFSTPAGGASIDLDLGLAIPGGSTIPVPLIGNPIGPGNTDTIVERLGGLPDGGTGAIPIELVALSLVSVDPVDIGGSFFDVFVNLDLGTPSLGTLTVTGHDDGIGGGTFDSFFDVFVVLTLAEVGNPTNALMFPVQDRIATANSP